MSLQVWCYECDDFVSEDWQLIQDLMAATEVDIIGDETPTHRSQMNIEAFGGVSGYPSANMSPGIRRII